MGEDKAEYSRRLKDLSELTMQAAMSGKPVDKAVMDEKPVNQVKAVNLLADLISRAYSEEDALLAQQRAKADVSLQVSWICWICFTCSCPVDCTCVDSFFSRQFYESSWQSLVRGSTNKLWCKCVNIYLKLIDKYRHIETNTRCSIYLNCNDEHDEPFKHQ